MDKEKKTENCMSSFKEKCFWVRKTTQGISQKVYDLMSNPDFLDGSLQDFPGQHGEMKANIMLAYRHLEDARMRIGKAIQAADGGKSCYPR